MASRTVIVPPDSEILLHESTEVLHAYSGDLLVRTEAVTPEAEASSEMPVRQGIQLQGVHDDDLEHARTELFLAPEGGIPFDGDQELIVAYVELIGPVDPEWLEVLKEVGVEPLRFHPENTYLCRSTRDAFREANEQPFVLHVTPLTSALKPSTVMPEVGDTRIWIVLLVAADEAFDLIEEVSTLPGVEIDPDQEIDAVDFYLRIPATVTAEGHDHLVSDPRVLATEPFVRPQPEDEVAGLILAGQYDARGMPAGSYLQWLEDYGINGGGVTIGIVDNGVDVSHVAFSARIRELDGGKKRWHGTFVAGHAAGRYLVEKDSQGYIYGLGMAPGAELLAQDNQRSATTLCKETVTETGPSGYPGSVQNNSWGMGTHDPMDYSSLEATYDRLVRNADPSSSKSKPLTICFSSGNSGPSGLTRPKAAKNVIVTGNSENYRPGVGKDESDNINEVYNGSHASSHGNCGDGRIRPHVVAPGEWTASANYDSHPGQREYISAMLTWGGGSSGASPKTAGACALLTQWWRRHNFGIDPSPAMLRALVVNGAEHMRYGGPIPNKHQGWGRLNLENIVAQDVHRTYVDQTILLRERGEEREWRIWVSDPYQPVKITLAWTDPPGPIGSGTARVPAITNKLALRVEVNGEVYRGNNFSNGWSVSGPLADPSQEGWDNLQNVYLAPGVATDGIRIIVSALDLTTNCLTGQVDTPQQDFALVITNGHPDEGYTPADFFIVVDDSMGSEPSSGDPGDYWDDTPGSSDDDELDSDWWGDFDEDSDDQSASEPSDDDGWWDNWWNDWFGPETEAHRPARLTDNEVVVEGLRAGVDILTTRDDHQVVSPSSEAGEVPAGSLESSNRVHVKAETGRVHDKIVDASERDLSQALADLMTNWDRYGASPNGSTTVRRRVAVIVVRSGTRVSRQDLESLRRLAFMGQLYILSDSSALLAFLAQRIHRRQGVQYRLATDTTELASLVRDTLADSSGAQRLDVQSDSRAAEDEETLLSAHRFHVVENDTHISVFIQHQLDEDAPHIRMRRPGQNPFTLTPRSRRKGIQVTQREGATRIDIDGPADGQGWAGQWEIRLKQDGRPETPAEVSVWAWGRLVLTLRKKDAPLSEAGRDAEEDLVALTGNAGVTFNRCRIETQVIGDKSQPITEAGQPIDVAVEPSRLELDAMEGENAALVSPETEPALEAHSPCISAWVPSPRASHGANVVDLQLRAKGADAAGNHFYRRLRRNLIHLEPRSAWRRRLPQRTSYRFFPARISQVHYSNGTIAGLYLHKDGRERYVAVSSDALREQLAEVDLAATDLHFAVRDRELVGVIRTPTAAGQDEPVDETVRTGVQANQKC